MTRAIFAHYYRATNTPNLIVINAQLLIATCPMTVLYGTFLITIIFTIFKDRLLIMTRGIIETLSSIFHQKKQHN